MHKWTYDENCLCCKLYLEFALDKTPFKSIAELKYKVERALPQIKEGSIRMKLQNIKYLCDTEPEARRLFPNGDGVRITPLYNATPDNRRAFLHVLNNYLNGFVHFWTYDEEYHVCELFISFRYKDEYDRNPDKLTAAITQEFPDISRDEIEKKLEEVKSVDSASPSWNSLNLQTIRAYADALKELVEEEKA